MESGALMNLHVEQPKLRTMKGSIYNRLHIPTPCHEDWNKMTPDAKGAFCKQCNKSVHDFTQRSEEEVQTILESLKGQEVCGRFNNSQLASLPELNISLQTIPFDLSPFKKFMVAALIVFGTTLFGLTNAFGQKVGKIKLVNDPPVHQPEITMKGEVAVMPRDTIKLPACTKDTTEYQLMGDTVVMEGPLRQLELPPVDSIEAVLPEPIMIVEVVSVTTGAVSVIYEPVVEPMMLGQMAVMPVTEPEPPALPVDSLNKEDDPVTLDVEDNTAGPDPVPVNTTENRTAPALPAEEHVPAQGLKCWPNPSDGHITLSYEIKKQCDVKIELYDKNGRQVMIMADVPKCYNAIYNTSFDLSALDPGTYSIRLIAGNDARTTQVVIIK
jgi:hypothetical protein